MFRVVQVGSAGTSGMVSDDSETFGLDNLESEVAEEHVRHASVMKTCSKKNVMLHSLQ